MLNLARKVRLFAWREPADLRPCVYEPCAGAASFCARARGRSPSEPAALPRVVLPVSFDVAQYVRALR